MELIGQRLMIFIIYKALLTVLDERNMMITWREYFALVFEEL